MTRRGSRDGTHFRKKLLNADGPVERILILLVIAVVAGVTIGLLMPKANPTVGEITGEYTASGSAAQTLPCLRVVGWDVAILPGGKLELIEGNHNPGMNIVQAPAKHGVHDKFAHMLLDFYGDPAQYACETVKQP